MLTVVETFAYVLNHDFERRNVALLFIFVLVNPRRMRERGLQYST